MILEESHWLPVFGPICQRVYTATRFHWNADPENELQPFPQQGEERKPPPGTYDGPAEQDG